MKRILIIGNGGSGKTYLSHELSRYLEVEPISTDSMLWKNNGYEEKKSPIQRFKEVAEILGRNTWIVEGYLGKLIEPFAKVADLIVFLDFPWSVCERRIKERECLGQTENSLQRLIAGCSTYYERTDKNSRHFHLELCRKNEGLKSILKDQESVNQWLSHINNHGLEIRDLPPTE